MIDCLKWLMASILSGRGMAPDNNTVPQEINSGEYKLPLGNVDNKAVIMEVLKQLTKGI